MIRLLVIFALLFSCNTTSDHNNSDKTKPKTDVALSATFDVFTSIDLYNTHSMDPEKFSIKYKGKVIEVLGKVVRAYDNKGTFVIELDTNNDKGLVSCNMASKIAEQIKIQSEQRIKGIYSGYSKDIIISNCILK